MSEFGGKIFARIHVAGIYGRCVYTSPAVNQLRMFEIWNESHMQESHITLKYTIFVIYVGNCI